MVFKQNYNMKSVTMLKLYRHCWWKEYDKGKIKWYKMTRYDKKILRKAE